MISIHALREEGDNEATKGLAEDGQFQSTPSARRATVSSMTIGERVKISIHALREEGDRIYRAEKGVSHISIHALREEGDHEGLQCLHLHGISIHALREEGDL